MRIEREEEKNEKKEKVLDAGMMEAEEEGLVG